MKIKKSWLERVEKAAIPRTKFALFPTEMDDGSVIWLEKYLEWKENYYGGLYSRKAQLKK